MRMIGDTATSGADDVGGVAHVGGEHGLGRRVLLDPRHQP